MIIFNIKLFKLACLSLFAILIVACEKNKHNVVCLDVNVNGSLHDIDVITNFNSGKNIIEGGDVFVAPTENGYMIIYVGIKEKVDNDKIFTYVSMKLNH